MDPSREANSSNDESTRPEPHDPTRRLTPREHLRQLVPAIRLTVVALAAYAVYAAFLR